MAPLTFEKYSKKVLLGCVKRHSDETYLQGADMVIYIITQNVLQPTAHGAFIPANTVMYELLNSFIRLG